MAAVTHHVVWGELSRSSESASAGQVATDTESRAISSVEFREISSSSTSNGKAREPEQKQCRSIEELLSATGYWSQGSALHESGQCKPCYYVTSRAGCNFGNDCKYCHIPHTDKSKGRVGMSRREYCKGMADKVREVWGDDKEALQDIVNKTAAHSTYWGSLVQVLVDDNGADKVNAVTAQHDGDAHSQSASARAILGTLLEDMRFEGRAAAASADGSSGSARRVVGEAHAQPAPPTAGALVRKKLSL